MLRRIIRPVLVASAIAALAASGCSGSSDAPAPQPTRPVAARAVDLNHVAKDASLTGHRLILDPSSRRDDFVPDESGYWRANCTMKVLVDAPPNRDDFVVTVVNQRIVVTLPAQRRKGSAPVEYLTLGEGNRFTRDSAVHYTWPAFAPTTTSNDCAVQVQTADGGSVDEYIVR
jgi:hypothetical protein